MLGLPAARTPATTSELDAFEKPGPQESCAPYTPERAGALRETYTGSGGLQKAPWAPALKPPTAQQVPHQPAGEGRFQVRVHAPRKAGLHAYPMDHAPWNRPLGRWSLGPALPGLLLLGHHWQGRQQAGQTGPPGTPAQDPSSLRGASCLTLENPVKIIFAEQQPRTDPRSPHSGEAPTPPCR
ncbi:hypothetical protein P7K49_003306 [Saguinus oedipus]|uniref:Uncharacterized protein n=1 Tax=Saguinus oedipus TaxID=9490 RepID=A0ABQ9WK81_SAGOE|nr:hypothetical protein P7K49_003306 [Saguinus oedipus]